MIGINDINYYNRKIDIDCFNIMYSSNVDKRTIFYDNIISVELCEDTYHKTPEEFIIKLNDNFDDHYYFLQNENNNMNILDYYLDCYKLDTVPYISAYSLIEGLDNQVMDDENSFKLTDEMFNNIALKIFNKSNNKDKKEKGYFEIDIQLAMNVICIYNGSKGLYVLAYKPLKLDIANKCLVSLGNIIVNKEFAYDKNTGDIKNKDSISKFIAEEDLFLLDDVENNKDKIMEAIRQYNDTKHSSYSKEVKTDSTPYILSLAKNIIVDLNTEFLGIKEMIEYPDEKMTIPIKAFLGYNNIKKTNRSKNPVFVISNKYDIDQINAIYNGMKSYLSYLQGPPGTGKTNTILNAVVTAMINDKSVLITSNNNTPMDGIYDDILKLEYRNDQLLFPAIRLGNNDNINDALDRIKEMYNRSKYLKPDITKIEAIKKERKEALSELVELLSNYEKIQELQVKKNCLENNLNKITNEEFKEFNILQIEKINDDIKEIGSIDLNNFESLVRMDYYKFKMAIHFETAQRLQKLDNKKYSEILDIIDLPSSTSEEKRNRIKAFKAYLSNDESLKKFQDIFPIIISTNLSCTYLGTPKEQFDIVLMDEAGQCSIANSLIPIIRAKQLMLVGDPQQLKPVVVLDGNINKILMEKYHIPKEYDYIQNSIYSAFTSIDVENLETLLSYHYRCNSKIIEFSNKKYYNGKLKIRSDSKENQPLEFYDTSVIDKNDNIYLKNVSRSEAEFIVDYIKKHPSQSIGIITPFVKQKECIQNYLENSKINCENVTIGTVHAYQGEQKDTIIFSTAITNRTHQKTYDWLKNNRELINVAVTRAINKLVVLGNKNAINNLDKNKNDLKELAEYVQTNGLSQVSNSSISSEALGTRQISTESELDFQRTIKHALSVLDNNCYIKEEVPVSSLFNKDSVNSKLFYMQKFDIVIFKKCYGGDKIVLIFELNGPEHLTEQDLIDRDNEKKRLCEIHNIEILSIPRDCARDYNMIKSAIKEVMKTKKR